MLGLTITSVEITAETNGGLFSARLNLKKGLNILRADNTSGKSTCVNSIAYGLGLEHILGPSRQRPFPRSLYTEIFDNKADKNPYFVSRSYVSLEIENHSGRKATLTRDIKGYENKISIQEGTEKADYFLGSAGAVGSAKSEKGVHHWLAGFIGWQLPDVVTFDGREVKLYLECIFPLFFIEQKRGWSEIQANIPSNYGIRNVKRSAVEFCLGIDGFELEKKITNVRFEIEEQEKEWENILAIAENVADFHQLKLSPIPPIEKYTTSYKIDYAYLEGDVEIGVHDQKVALQRRLDALSKNLAKSTPQNERLSEQQSSLRGLRRKIEEQSQSLELSMIAIRETETKLTTLSHDLDQYQQLKRLKTVGSEISDDLETKKCPICESDLYDTLGNRTVKRQPMTLDENIDFLKSQKAFFENVKDRNITQLQEKQRQAKLLQTKLLKEERIYNQLKEDIDDINGETKELLRERINLENQFNQVEKLTETLDDLNEKAASTFTRWSIRRDSLKLLRKEEGSGDSMNTIRELEALIRGNLTSFGFNSSDIGSITISPQTFRPEQEGYDIVAETSASDYIRIIWSYTLALMEIASKHKELKHGGFVVFDEPRQHETNKISFMNLVEKAAESIKFHGQVIFATSLEESELAVTCSEKGINLISFDDYILTLKPVAKD
jgi:hypothetical protein